MAANQHWTRVILLTPPQRKGLADSIKSQFASRDWFAVEETDPYLAMTELCLRERAQMARAAWGLQRMEQTALVITHPDHWLTSGIQIQDFIAAVIRFLPTASIWQAENDQLLPLHAGITPPVAAIQQPAGNRRDRSARSSNHSAPALRLAGDATAESPIAAAPLRAPKPKHSTQPATVNPSESLHLVGEGSDLPKELENLDSDSHASRTRLTRQEIDMLLEIDPADAPREAAS